jgi:hypothetical protein
MANIKSILSRLDAQTCATIARTETCLGRRNRATHRNIAERAATGDTSFRWALASLIAAGEVVLP